MPEPPDFDQIASTIVDRYRSVGEIRGVVDDALIGAIVGALRLVWNARGAADLKAVADERASDAAVGWIATAIREQDR